MAIVSKEELLASIKKLVGENSDDESLKLLEDFSDTFDDLKTRTSDTTDWEKKFKENDEAWRQKYRDRFFGGGEDNNNTPPPTPEPQPDDKPEIQSPETYDDLFTVKEG